MTNRRSPVSRREAEHLLDGGGPDHALAGLLAAARRPGDPASPARGEEAARAAYRSAPGHGEGRRRTAPGAGRTHAVGRLVAAKLLVAATVAAVGAGAAVAATSTGEVALVRVAAGPVATPPVASPDPARISGSAVPTAAPSPARTAARPPTTARKGSAPAGATDRATLQRRIRLVSACVTWPQWQRLVDRRAALARLLAQRGRQLPPLRVPDRLEALVRAAGGERRVPAFCRGLAEQVCSSWPQRPRTTPGSLPRRAQPPCVLRFSIGLPPRR